MRQHTSKDQHKARMVACCVSNTDVDDGLRVKNVVARPDWSQVLTDAALDQLAQHGFYVLQQALPTALYQGLCAESQQLVDYQAANLIAGVQAAEIRSDRTRWLEADLPYGGQYLHCLTTLAAWLNAQCYLGIRRAEAHYACYGQGQFYRAHRDNPQGSRVRAMSTVLYLNSNWDADWGGELRLQDAHGVWHQIVPYGNQLLIFQSDLLHEVLPARHTRRSIAGWLRRDDVV